MHNIYLFSKYFYCFCGTFFRILFSHWQWAYNLET